MRSHFRQHALGWLVAGLVGFICVAPQIFFITRLGSSYQGIHFFATPNEEAYLAIIHEVLDGHPLVASMPFFEYKNQLPLLPPTMAYGYVLVSIFFNISLVTTLIISKFFLPAFLFFLVYFLLVKLLEDEERNSVCLTAICGGLMVTFGFDLVDYRTLIKYFSESLVPSGFLIWTRPLNPIAGAILLFFFLINIFSFLKNRNTVIKTIVWPALALALMMASYFFSWSLALTILGVLGIWALTRQDWRFIRYASLIVLVAMVISAPYWFVVIKASMLPWYAEAAARIGLWKTHLPHVNKFLTLIFLWFIGLSFWEYRKNGLAVFKKQWWQFCLALLVAGFLVYNQQIITGREIWYYHYVFYTIPIGYVVFLTSGFFIVRPSFKKIWNSLLIFFGLSALTLGIFTQVSAYRSQFSYYESLQKYRPLFDYFNNQAPKDSVVLVNEISNFPATLIPAFTHSNIYISGERLVIAPQERFVHNYMVWLRLQGIGDKEVETYLQKHRAEVAGLLYYQLQSTLGFPDPKFEETLKKLPIEYKEFLQKDFSAELKKYRIDYILSPESFNTQLLREVPTASPVFTVSGMIIYQLP
ncbi:MAG: hypothetical protein A2821_03075 [Candidatus Magasanikbacteria bacterium RIFCSPHIGHO2_01_FULL_41_23]|uniref:Glycosyltransferase RgtA/B/C/D-like domain-containing protein n=1 Tax=Candidatus Magasanikbacteria bacterium RIFCSPLOWO2_01_FULL_40_15 TaxID=1798686 RepID=A0A1F6N3H8_9BACT|nr:MAG: hypothetical protein A2821_03075 [Candidatus Magasanikbacteria bacterium RIFCSPHIGHO2_01_FULL_41_23]OGH67320.1 MAG: hypothetical protein A3C66_01090 [Candidatus Magasanikbacteria bacterium RIFCSPHIGHO2_02_FULL_41_35]OGH76545.1 MAG: hypothetical protein A3F22_00300 [Candidatus Magasanikbacteria bacterium RIFCSPHIGHO2_12_FULL_41_16]OGH78469.1 MAG: hypothetical protein A2983_03055 [Candidatus Magasanikbacteria bacterium RIFCSPLOWO2_01_FULL_40_15]